ncbi:hypothetical protein CHUAL_003695 [Chamberlinius hualienensis]
MVDFWGRVLQNNAGTVSDKSDVHVISSNGSSCPKTPQPLENGCRTSTSKPSNLFRTVLNSSNDFFSGLHTKLNAALSLDDNDDEADNDSDSIFNNYMKKTQRDSGGDFGESSTTSTSFDNMGGGFVPKAGLDRYPKRWMDPTMSKHKTNISNSSSLAATSATESVISAGGDYRSKKSKTKKTKKKNNGLDSDPISSNESDGSESEARAARDIDSSLGHSTSEASLLSWSSNASHESQNDETNNECTEYMRQFVEKLLHNNTGITLEEKAEFGKLCQTESGRLWFARCINAQRMNKKVSESTFYSLIQYFAIAIFECSEADDYAPAKSMMNMCFTFYHEVAVPGCEPYKEFLYLYLKDQPIWQSLRFWNAAFFDAVQCERAHRPIVTRKQLKHYSAKDICDEKEFQENITFGQLGSFTCNMHAFGLSKELCLEFLRKQSTIADLKPGQIATIKENIERMYSETEPWRS